MFCTSTSTSHIDSSSSEDECSTERTTSTYTNSNRRGGNRLDFSTNRKFYGRRVELQKISTIFDNCCNCESTGSIEVAKASGTPAGTPFTLVSGYSGVGKSAFVRQFVHELNENSLQGNCKPCLFLSGKYFNLLSADPYSAIVDAFNGFFLSLMDGDEDDEEELQRVIKDTVETVGVTEASLLTSLVPSLARIIRKEVLDACTDTAVLQDSKEKTWNRLKFIIQALLKAICKKNRPVIMFLDDLQWADSASLELITVIVTDKTIKYFMLVGAIRPDEVNDDHPLSHRLEDIKETKRIERINLSNLSLEEIGEFVADTLELGLEESKDVTELLYTKTEGNIFFTQQVLEDLFRKKLLYYCRNSFQWRWITKEIDQTKEGGVSDDVTDVVASRIMSLPKKLQTALIIVAYTRRSVDIDTLQSLMKIKGCTVGLEELIQLLDMAVLEGLLSNHIGSGIYSFAHDRIQQAAYSLVEQGQERDKLRLEIGKCLYTIFPTDTGKDWMLFVAADSMNSSISINMELLAMARINLEVAQKVIKVAAFSEALSYLKKALEKVTQIPYRWDEHYDLCFQLYQLLVDVELCLGNYDHGYKLGKFVIEKTKRNIDKISMFRTLAQALQRQQRHQESLEMNKKALSLLGATNTNECFRLIHVVVNFLKMRKLFKRVSDEEIIGLPRMKNESKLVAANLLRECNIEAFFCGNATEFLFSTLEHVRIIFKYGISAHSSSAFTFFGVILNNAGEKAAAVRAAQLSKKLSYANPENAREAIDSAVSNVFILAYNTPHLEIMESYRRSRKLGLGSGDIFWGFTNWICLNQHAYLCGFHLEEVERGGAEIVEQMKSYKIYSLLYPFIEMRRIFPYLLRRNKDPVDWKVLEDIGQQLLPDGTTASSQKYRLGRMCITCLQLGVYFGNYQFADKMSDKLLELEKLNNSYTYISFKLLFTGVAAFFLARDPQTKDKKRNYYISKARKQYKQMSKCFKYMGRNCHHRYLILKAIVIALSKKKTSKQLRDVQDAYDYAISASTRAEHIQDTALCNELAGEYFLSENNIDLSINYFTQAWHSYSSWGAAGKANHLKENRGLYIDASFKKVMFCRSTNSYRSINDQAQLFQKEKQEEIVLSKMPELVNLDNLSESKGGVSSFSGGSFRSSNLSNINGEMSS